MQVFYGELLRNPVTKRTLRVDADNIVTPALPEKRNIFANL
jgi:hypothetical protein